jgi:membrane protein YqaA with SNARE-associated domain
MHMNGQLFLDVLVNSFWASLLVTMDSEIAWFSCLNFLPTNQMLDVTIAALMGSTTGLFCCYGVGWLLALDRQQMPLSEEKYHRAARIAGFYILPFFLFPWTPFLAIIAAAMGFLHTKFWHLALAIVVGRLVFYSYYLFYA